MDIYNSLKDIIARELNCTTSEITDDAGWKTFYNWDSLAHVGIISAVEDYFSIQIEDHEIEKLDDFNSILQYVINKKSQ